MIATARKAARTASEGEVSRARLTADIASLAGLLDACEAAGVERQALVLRLSPLPVDICRPHHIRLARKAVEALQGCDRARVFYPTQADTIVVWRGDAGPLLGQVRTEVAHLFNDLLDDEAVRVTEHLLLPRDSIAVRRLLPSEDAEEPAEAETGTGVAPGSGRRLPMGLQALSVIEARLADGDLARFVRRRPVWRVAEGQARLAWEECSLSVIDIAGTAIPGYDVQSDPWLFSRLTRTLDRRLLGLLSGQGSTAFSLNLNVGSLDLPAFARFDAALPAALRGKTVIEFRPHDVVADPAAFAVARDRLRARGYRLLMRLSAPSQLALLPAERLGVDLVRLRWTAALDGSVPPRAFDPATLVLARAGTARARTWGRAHGVTLFGDDH